DTLRRADGTDILPAPVPVLSAGDGGTLDPGEVWTYEVTHVLAQADVDSGGLTNSVRATATAPDGDTVSDLSDTGTGTGSTPTPFVIPAAPALETLKTTVAAPTGLGDTVIFEVTAQNTGTVTLTGVTVTDSLTRTDGTPLSPTSGPSWLGADQGSAEGTLTVGETATWQVTYALSQADIDAGGIENTATATGTPPSGPPVSDPVDTPVSVPIAAAPAIDMIKTRAAGAPATVSAVGDVIDFEFAVTNNGNVTLTDPITVADPLIDGAGGTVTCPAPPLAPGATATCTGSYSVTQAELDAGSVVNTATASVPGADPSVDSVTVPVLQAPALEVIKTPQDLPAEDFIVGAVVSYTYTATNTGNVTLTDPVTVTDNLIPVVNCDPLPAGGLAPGAALTCTGDYTVTPDDVLLASVTNLARASSGDTDSPQVSATVPNDGTPSLGLDKAILTVTDAGGSDRPGGRFAEVGDILTFEFTVTNTGEVSFAAPVEVVDDHIPGPIACFTPDAGNPDLIPGEVVTCQASYTVTQADLDAGRLLNSGFAQTEFGTGPTQVVSPPDTEEVLADGAPELTLDKSVDSTVYAAIGDVLTYTLVVENTGNQSVSGVTVTDPLLPGLSCDTGLLAPGDSASCNGSLTVTQADIDAGEVVNTATASGLSPTGTAIRDDSDPVTSTGPTGAGTLSLVKSASPDPFGGAGSTLTYGFAVTNEGPFTLSDVTVTDPLVPGYVCTIPTLAVGATDSATCRMPYTVTQADVDAGQIVNTATAGWTAPSGATDSTTDTLTTPGPAADPELDVTKTASVPATTLGSVITFTLQVENTGNVTLTPGPITDTMTRIDTGAATALDAPFAYAGGDTDTDGALDVGEVWTYTAPHTITQSDINAGGVRNTATVTATDPNDTAVSDVSDDGIDANGDDTPTEVPITRAPELVVTKSVASSGAEAGNEVVFRIEAANRGNVDITDVTISDDLSRRDGTALSAPAPVRVSPGVGDTTLAPGSVWAWELRYTLTQADVDAGGLSNLATAEGQGPSGTPVTGVSSDDDPGDGNPPVDPTELVIPAAPGLDLVKTTTSAPTMAGDAVTFDITATNIGNVTLSGLTLADTLTDVSGTPLTPDSITTQAGFDGTLVPGAVTAWTVAYTMSQADIDAGGIRNTATLAGTTPNGLPVSDTSDDGDDTDGDTTSDPTEVLVPADTTILADKSATVPERVAGSLFRVTFTITAENAGNVTHSDVQVTDDLAAWVAPAALISVAPPEVDGFDAAAANPGFDGAGDIDTLAPGAVLLPGQTGSVVLVVEYDIAGGSPAADNVAEVTSDRVSVPVQARASVQGSEPEPDLSAAKEVLSPGPFRAGSVVDYELSFTNGNTTAESGLTLVDELPAGMLYVDGSASLAPQVSGRSLTWPGITLAPGETLSVNLSAQLLGGAGEFTNTAYILDSTGARVSNRAEATLRVAPEPVFDCTDVIGKVFEDRNGNGYQDPPPDARAAITDQDIFVDGKFGTGPAEVEQQNYGEPGIPGVQLTTVRGDIITTDEFGRFHVPCAALPPARGANFTLKVDERSLPTGYRVSTENPRTLRLTPGIMAEMNFGVSLARLVDIDLTAAAFAGDRATPDLVAGIEAMVGQLAASPSVLRLTYYHDGEGEDAARARLQVVETLIRDAWRGDYALRIETTIARVQ
ncbi:MAG: DUF11 domain-containing protein, partial [Alphaproteobacteria bacterium]|nr:DUF11 domain-containing protein [Alphaproteobacteria bacterium]